MCFFYYSCTLVRGSNSVCEVVPCIETHFWISKNLLKSSGLPGRVQKMVPVATGDFVMRMLVERALQPEIATVAGELLHFDGSEFRFKRWCVCVCVCFLAFPSFGTSIIFFSQYLQRIAYIVQSLAENRAQINKSEATKHVRINRNMLILSVRTHPKQHFHVDSGIVFY